MNFMEDGNEVGVRKPGEIFVHNQLILLCYLNLEEDNRYPFREMWHPKEDIGRPGENGHLWYVRRKAEKELIKPGGKNVYPSDVEKAILEHPELAEASVIGVRDPEWGEAIKAICFF
jgi:long-chain acyl-CoA synthetase